MKYITKQQEVEAVQWTGENFPAIHEFAGDLIVGRKNNEVFMDVSISREPMKVSDFLMKDSLGFSVVSQEDFHAICNPVPHDGEVNSLDDLDIEEVDGLFMVSVPVILQIPVDPLEGFTKEEAAQVATERLAELDLEVALGGVPLDVRHYIFQP